MAQPRTPATDLVGAIAQYLAQNHSPRRTQEMLSNQFQTLVKAKFLSLADMWENLQFGQVYYTRVGAAAFAAFYIPHSEALQTMRPLVVATHLDFCRLDLTGIHGATDDRKVVTYPVKVYGGIKIHTWVDRDLGLTVYIAYTNPQQEEDHLYLEVGHPVLVIPSVAIHFGLDARASDWNVDINRDVRATYLQRHAQDTLAQLLWELVSEKYARKHNTPLTPNVWLHMQKSMHVTTFIWETPSVHGTSYLRASRQDDALLTFTAARAFLDAVMYHREQITRPIFFAAFNHEEIGSLTFEGAGGQMLTNVLERGLGAFAGAPNLARTWLRRTLLISSDVTHAQHPNRNDLVGGIPPLMNQGPIMTSNNGDSQASNVTEEAIAFELAERANINLQRLDMLNGRGCGHTIGPILSRELGIGAIELGVGLWGMHRYVTGGGRRIWRRDEGQREGD